MVEGMMRTVVSSGSKFEKELGFSRAVRVGSHITISGTAAIGPDGKTYGVADPAKQARRIFEIIGESLKELGASFEDVVRTRIMLRYADDWKAVGKVHGEVFGDIRPATCFVQVSRFIDPDWLVEIEVDAYVESDKS
jgi:Putative translation initiation inhibitor, yjgF family